MIMNLRSGIVLVLLIILSSLEIYGQQSREVFGKNRIQYRQFDWVYLSGENFDVYYYDARKAMAQEALEFLEGEFDRITDLIGYPPYFKTKVFIYNSLSDLRQSNVGLNHNVFNVGGETEFIKPYVDVLPRAAIATRDARSASPPPCGPAREPNPLADPALLLPAPSGSPRHQ